MVSDRKLALIALSSLGGLLLAGGVVAYQALGEGDEQRLDAWVEAARADLVVVDRAAAITAGELGALGHAIELEAPVEPSSWFAYPVDAVSCARAGEAVMDAAADPESQALVVGAVREPTRGTRAVSQTRLLVASTRGATTCAALLDLSSALGQLERTTRLVPDEALLPDDANLGVDAGALHLETSTPIEGGGTGATAWMRSDHGVVVAQTGAMPTLHDERALLVSGLIASFGVLALFLAFWASRAGGARTVSDATLARVGAELARASATALRPAQALSALERALSEGIPEGGDWRVVSPDSSEGSDSELVKRALSEEVDTSSSPSQHGVQGLFGLAPGRTVFVLRDAEGPRAVVVGDDPDERGADMEERAALLFRITLASLTRINLVSMLVNSERHAAVGRLAAGVAHEINNPLAYATANMSALAQSADPESRPMIDDALEGCERIEHIVRSLRVLFHGPEELVFEPVLIADLALSTSKMARAHRPGTPIEITRDDDVWVDGDPIGLGQILLNLMTNALDAVGAASNPRVRVHVSAKDGRAVVDVSDNGCGVDGAVADRLFDAFVTTKGRRGTGLGLGISRSFALAHGGELSLIETGSEGTTFRLTLPARARAPRLTSGVEMFAPTPPKGRTERPRLLIVDDEPALLRAVERWLRSKADITTAENGTLGLELATARQFDLILCDLNMPRMSGLDFVAALRQRSPEAAEKVVIATGSIDAKLGDVPSITKPLDPKVLRRLLWPPLEQEREQGEAAG